MPSDSSSQPEHDLLEVKGGLDILSTLREEFEQWMDEAQDQAKHEALTNVLAHIEVLQSQYRTREEILEKQAKAG
jgi:hypothetical protein